jgi:hypothetical protein
MKACRHAETTGVAAEGGSNPVTLHGSISRVNEANPDRTRPASFPVGFRLQTQRRKTPSHDRRQLMTHTNSTIDQSEPQTSRCCGGSAPEGVDACCARDAEVKADGGTGCGCGTAATAPTPQPRTHGCC